MGKPLQKPTAEEPTLGQRIRELRRARGLTQEELGKRAGMSRRMVIYYETQGGTAPSPVVARLARTLKVSADDLIGLSNSASTPLDGMSREDLRMWRRFQRVKQLSPENRRTVLRLIESLPSQTTK